MERPTATSTKGAGSEDMRRGEEGRADESGTELEQRDESLAEDRPASEQPGPALVEQPSNDPAVLDRAVLERQALEEVGALAEKWCRRLPAESELYREFSRLRHLAPPGHQQAA